MGILDILRPEPLVIHESEPGLFETIEDLQERLAELEFPLEDVGWQKLSNLYETEFSRDGLNRIISVSRLMGLKNPLINRAVWLQAMYVWGQGVSISARDKRVGEVVAAFLNNPKNQAELTTHQQRTLKEVELQTTGNLFFVFFSNISDGTVTVRTFDVEEVADIIHNPEDRKEPWFYKRAWSERTIGRDGQLGKSVQKVAYYPDWKLDKNRAELPEQIEGKFPEWGTPVYHVKVGGYSSMRFGVPETYAALDWAIAYKEFLEDWATLVRALSRFAWKMTVKGGARGVAASKAKLNTTLGDGGGSETNPAPITGAVWMATEGQDLQAIPKSGATVGADDGRRLLLMVAAATGLPETFFGDASVGSLATAKSLDRPTELKFLDRQELWKDIFGNILQFVIDQSALAANGRLATRQDGEQVELGTDGDGNAIDRTLDIEFPPMLEHDQTEAIDAVVKAVTLDGKQSAQIFDLRTIIRWIATAIGEDDIDELLDSLAPEEGEPTTQPFAGIAPPAPTLPDPNAADKGFMGAVNELREAIRKVRVA